MNRTWPPEDEAELARIFPHHTNAETGRLMGRTEYGVKIKALRMELLKSAEYKRALSIANLPPKVPGHREAFVASIEPLLRAPLGASMREICAYLSAKESSVKSSLRKVVTAGLLHPAGPSKYSRYFLTAVAAASAGETAIPAATKKAQREARGERWAQWRIERAAIRQAEADAKPAKIEAGRAARAALTLQRNAAKASTVGVVARPRKAPKPVAHRGDNTPVVPPPHIRVVRGPCNLDRRYTVREVTEPCFSALRPGQYPVEPSAWTEGRT